MYLYAHHYSIQKYLIHSPVYINAFLSLCLLSALSTCIFPVIICLHQFSSPSDDLKGLYKKSGVILSLLQMGNRHVKR